MFHAVLVSLTTYLSYENEMTSQDLINALLPRLAGILYNPQQRNKPGIYESGMNAYNLLKSKYPSDAVCAAIIASFNNPELARIAKVRVGIIGMMAEIDYTEWKVYLSKLSREFSVYFFGVPFVICL